MAKLKQTLRKLFKTVNREYKDALFKRCFEDKHDLLELYNALNDTTHTNADALEITTLEDCIYMTYKNDLSFIIYSVLNLYEHQSTYNPNMPIRGVLYFARLYEAHIKKQNLDIYKGTLIPLPEPKYIVFYNGTDHQPDCQRFRLSDAFVKNGSILPDEPALECVATMLNINYGHNQKLMDNCRRLHDYSLFIAIIRQNLEHGASTKSAIKAAMDQCIENHILEDILLKQKSEVYHMLLNEFDLEKYGRTKQQEGREEVQNRMVLILNNYQKAIDEKDYALAQKDNVLAQKDRALIEKDNALAQQKAEIERLLEENRKLKEGQENLHQ